MLAALKGDLEFRFQFQVVGYIVDFAWPKPRLAVEIDGEVHRRDSAWHRDNLRTSRIERAGWQLIRFNNEEVLNTPYAIVSEIRVALSILRDRAAR